MTKRHIFIALLAFAISAAAQLAYRAVIQDAVNDLSFPICGAQALLHGADPYTCALEYRGHSYPLNPLTTVLVALPFAPLGEAGAVLLWSTGVALLVAVLVKTPIRLLILLSAPFWDAFRTLQWSPLLLAIALLPVLLPLALVKPQTAIPIVLTRLSKRRALVCAAFVLLTLLIDPTWPWRWLPTTHSYDGFIPALLVPPLLLVLIRWRNPDARFFALMACVPQRGVYDALVLWAVSYDWRELLILAGFSWVALFWGSTVVWIYLPMLAILLLREAPILIHSKEAAPQGTV